MGVTYADIAKASGVSTATVSLVLRNPEHPLFNPATRARVLKTAEKFNYVPNRVAASLRGGKTQTLGMIMPYHEAELMDIAEQVAAELGYALMIQFTYKPNLDLELKALRAAMEHRVDGLLWQPTKTAAAYGNLPGQMRDYGMNVTFMERRLRSLADSDWAYCDFRQGIRSAIDHLRQQGYNRLVYVTQETDYVLRWWWLKLFRTYCKGDVEVIVYPAKPGVKEVQAGLKPLLGKKDRVGVFCDVDWAVMPVYEACENLGVSIPEQLGVVAMSDVLVGNYFRIGELCRPQFTAVRRHMEVLARTSVQLLVDRVQGKRKGPGKGHPIQTTLIPRETTAVTPPADSSRRSRA